MTRFGSLSLGEIMTLSSGQALVEITPTCGGRLIAFDVAGRSILRRSAPGALSPLAPYRFAGFPLIPYSGPIFGGGFFHDGSFHRLDRNIPAEGDAVHGDGWLLPWRTSHQTPSILELELDYLPETGHFPFRWRGILTYSLTGTTLDIAMSITNTDVITVPAGLGFHPYFPRSDGLILQFRHGAVWAPDTPEAVGIGPADPLEGLDFNEGLDTTNIVLDRCYEHWDGTATLHYPDGNQTLVTASPTFGKLQLYAPWDGAYVCVEPVTNANDGFNRAHAGVSGHAVVRLAPGETLSGSIRIAVGREAA